MTRLAEQTAASLCALVRGRVQGVNFRSFVYQRARGLRLSGYVRNLEDGRTVQVVAEGPRTDLQRLLELLCEGPRSAHVDGVDTDWGEASGKYAGFGVVE